jgi:hypothetical protein
MISRSLSGRIANRFGSGGLNPGGGVIDAPALVPVLASRAVHPTRLYRRFGFGLARQRTGELAKGPASELSTGAIQWLVAFSPLHDWIDGQERGELLECCEISHHLSVVTCQFGNFYLNGLKNKFYLHTEGLRENLFSFTV